MIEKIWDEFAFVIFVCVQSEDEQECSSTSLNKGEGREGKKGGLVRTSSDELKGLRTWSSQHSPFQPSHPNLVK